MLIQTLIILAVTLAILYYFSGLKRKRLPPGPRFCIPIVGHLPFLGDTPSRTFLQWSKCYGPILSVQMGSYPAIVINDSHLIRRAFNLNSFSGRPHLKFIDEASGNRKGFMFSDGPKAMEQRRFTQKMLKDFGYGTNSMERRILDQVPSLLEVFEDHLSKPLNVKHAFNHSFLSVLWTIVAGEVLDKNDRGFQKLAVNVSEGVEMTSVIEKLAVFLNFIPVWLPNLSGFNKKIQGMVEIQKYLDSLIKEHQRTKVTDQPRDILDAYLDKVEKTSDHQSGFFAARKEQLCDRNVTIAMQDLFVAGVETTSTALEWITFYLAKYPIVQEKLRSEIDDALESTSFPSSDDRPKLPYVEAVIEEVLRISSSAPLSLLHNSLEDTEFNGYCIPKDTMVVGNTYAVHHDKDVWGDPDIFRPERFLGDDGKFVKSNNVLAFSCGKRSCIGENLARLQLFLFTVSIFQRFTLKPVGQLPSENGIYGFSVSVHPFQVYVSRRC